MTRRHVGRWRAWAAEVSGGEVVVVQVGVGLRRAEEAARAVVESAPFDLLVSAGCAGALDPALRPGDLVIAGGVVGDDTRFETDAVFEAQATHICKRLNLPFRHGDVLTSPTVLTTIAGRRAAAERSNAIAVEMEAAAIARVAAMHGVGFGQVRAVLDSADVELHESGDFMDPESGRLRPMEVLRFVATHPSAATRLLGLRRMMVAAEKGLEGFWAGYFAELCR